MRKRGYEGALAQQLSRLEPHFQALPAEVLEFLDLWRRRTHDTEEAAYIHMLRALEAYLEEHEGRMPRSIRRPETEAEKLASQLNRFVQRNAASTQAWQLDALKEFPLVEVLFAGWAERARMPPPPQGNVKPDEVPSEDEGGILESILILTKKLMWLFPARGPTIHQLPNCRMIMTWPSAWSSVGLCGTTWIMGLRAPCVVGAGQLAPNCLVWW